MKHLKMLAILLAGFSSLTACDQFAMENAQEVAAALLRDPSSAQFRKVRTDDQGNVCGEINGKNSFGAYSGFSEFHAFEASGTWIARINDEEELAELPAELAQMMRETHETAMARCDRDKDREKAILDRQIRRMCDEGEQDMCKLIKSQDRVPQANI